MADIFVSYATEDRARIGPLVERFQREGWSVWWDRELVAGPSFEDEIERALDAADCVVVAWSQHSVASRWCRAEANEGAEGERLVPLRIDDVRPPLRFRESHTGSLIAWPEQAGEIDVVLDGIRECLARRRPASAGVVMPSLAEPELRLAVLPFDNLSGDEELLYFSDGVSEEIIQTVANTTGACVIGRSSSFQFRGADKGVRAVAAELGCSHVLDGSVRRSGARVRITAQLIECDRQTTVWTDRFDRELTDVFALQDEIAAAVADALKLAFAPSASSGPIDPDAYDLFLRSKRSHAQWLGANDVHLLEQAVSRAPQFAQAWASLAVSRAIEAHMERDPALSAAPRERAIEAARKALQLDPTLGAAHAALSITEPICCRFAERHAHIQRALRAAPNDPVVLFWASRWSSAVGRNHGGLLYARRASEVDPLWPQGVHQYRQMMYVAGMYAESWQLWRDMVSRWPRLAYLYAPNLLTAALHGDWPRLDEVTAALRASGLALHADSTQDDPIPGVVQMDLARILREVDVLRDWDAGRTRALAATLTAELERTGTLRLQLQWACEQGLADHVYGLVKRASYRHLLEPGGRLHPRDYGLHALFHKLGADVMHRDRRFVGLCDRLGLVDYWIVSGQWPDCADELSADYNFRAEAHRLAAARS